MFPSRLKQFVITVDGVPTHPMGGRRIDAFDPNNWLRLNAALSAVQRVPGSLLGFVLTSEDPYFLIDLDDALVDGVWSDFAVDICHRFKGAYIEVSRSNKGLHIVGKATYIPHRCRKKGVPMELYTEGRVITLTGTNMVGDTETDHTDAMYKLIQEHLAPIAAQGVQWTEGPVARWAGLTDDAALIEKAIASKSAAAAFGSHASFEDLWNANTVVLGAAYPPMKGFQPYDASAADAALAKRLAFWTGGDCERILRLMKQSELRRDKWGREDYLRDTIMNACAITTTYHAMRPVDNPDLPKLRAASEAQRNAAGVIREQKLLTATPTEYAALTASRGPATNASFWLDNRAVTTDALAEMVVVNPDIDEAPQKTVVDLAPRMVLGLQYLTPDNQVALFKGCVYIQDQHRILTPDGTLLDQGRFNSFYGGYEFALDALGEKSTRKAWDALVESQAIRWPKVASSCFRPALPTGAIVVEDGRQSVNVYVEIKTERKQGDPTPFLEHLAKLLPDARDRQIILSYMAACVQHKGVKFQWAPLLQGCEGNGKTLLTRCLAFAVGKRYTHMPKASELDSKFNGWMLHKLLIGVEDIYVEEHRREILEALKPMITGGDGLEIQLKGVDQVTADVCCNFILNSNYRNAIRKTPDDRRYAVFYTAQQRAIDLKRDNMSGSYFPKIYSWLRAEGYAIVNELLHTYPIPDEFNPATLCQRAPRTSSTDEALAESLGAVEQEVLEAIAEGYPGFKGGWVSGAALDTFLQSKGRSKQMPANRRREMLETFGFVVHPALPDGRAPSPSVIDGGKRPRLFVRTTNPAMTLTDPSLIMKAYLRAQET